MWALGTFLCFPWLVEHLEPEGIESHAKRIGANLLAVSGSESGSHMTLRWREPDSNFWPRNRSSSAVFNAARRGRGISAILVFDAHLAQIRRATVLSVEGSRTLSGEAGQLQA